MQEPSNHENFLVIANEVLLSDETSIETDALIAIEDIGYQFGMAAAGRKDRIRDFFHNVLLPGIKSVQKEFDLNVKLISGELYSLKGENFAGPKTARLVILVSTGESLIKLLPGILGGHFDLTHLTPTYIMNWAFLYVMLTGDLDNR